MNAPRVPVSNGNQDGMMDSGNADDKGVNYQPSRIYPREELQSARYSHTPLSGSTQQVMIAKPQNFRRLGSCIVPLTRKSGAI